MSAVRPPGEGRKLNMVLSLSQSCQNGVHSFEPRLATDSTTMASDPGNEQPLDITTLLTSEERYRAFVRNSSEAIWRFEIDTPLDTSLPVNEQVRRMFESAWLAECNEAMARMYGFTAPQEIIGTRLTELMPSEDPENVEYLTRFVESGYRLVDIESHERDRHGRPKFFLNNLTGIVEGNRLLRAWGTQRDITEQRLAAEAAKRQQSETDDALKRYAQLEQRLTLLTAATGRLLSTLDRTQLTDAIVDLAVQLVHGADAAAMWRMDGGRWSITSQRGLSDEFVGRSKALPPANSPVRFDGPSAIDDVFADPITEARRDAYRAEGLASMLVAPLRIGGADSGSVVFYARTPGRFDEVDLRVAAALANIAASALHITDLYEGQRAAEHQARFLAHAGSMLAGTLDVEATLAQIAHLAVPHIADWCVVHVARESGPWEPLVVAHVNADKVRKAEMLAARFPPDPKEGTGIAEVIRTRRSQLVEHITDAMLVAAAHTPEHLEVLREMELRSALLVPMTRGDRVVGVISLVTTSESSRALGQRELDIAEALASRATLALENARLYREAQDANRLKDQFLATLSHELRTPLNAVLGWARVLEVGKPDRKLTAKALQAIQRNTQAQAQIVGDILELSRIIAGKTDLVMDTFDLRVLLVDLIESLRPTLVASGLAVVSTLDDELPIEADRGRVQQIMLNLLSNAAKFTTAGGRVTIDARATDDCAEVSITDTGVGIAPEFLPHVFDRFRQAEPSTSRSHGGLGIGLAVSRHLVELHGGSISATSAGLGQGATFVVRLPRSAAVAEHACPEDETYSSSDQTR